MAASFKVVNIEHVVSNVGTDEEPILRVDTAWHLHDGINARLVYTKMVPYELGDMDQEYLDNLADTVLAAANA